VTSYRLYTLSTDDHIRGVPYVGDYATDAAAMEKGRQLLDGNTIEVWHGARLVGRLEPDDKGPP
jgi:hypothetical protein